MNLNIKEITAWFRFFIDQINNLSLGFIYIEIQVFIKEIMKSFFNLVNSVVGGEEKQEKVQVKLPWEDYTEQAKGLGIRGSLKDVLRDEMSQIYSEEKRLLDKENSLEDFSIDEKYDCILKILEVDLNLREFYRKVVPGKASEEVFWRNYFEITEEIKDRVLKRYAQKSHASKELSELRNSLLDELDKELEAEVQEPKPRVQVKNEEKGESKPTKNYTNSANASDPLVSELNFLKESLAQALSRIDILESRVQYLESLNTSSNPPAPETQ